jgi:hypothetical protein
MLGPRNPVHLVHGARSRSAKRGQKAVLQLESPAVEMSLDASDVMDEIAVVGVEQLAETQAAECTAIRSILMSRRSRSGNQR